MMSHQQILEALLRTAVLLASGLAAIFPRPACSQISGTPASLSATAQTSHRLCNPKNTTGPAVTVVRLVLAGTPALLRIPAQSSKAPIVLWHGFGTPGSEQELMDALPLDDVPAVKVFLGLPLFGARSPAPDEDSLANRQRKNFATLLFAPVVLGAADELAVVLRTLKDLGCVASSERIGVFGFSAGGTAALIALADDSSRLSAVVTINAPIGLTDDLEAAKHATGQPYYLNSDAQLLRKRSDVINRVAAMAAGEPPVALLQIHGTKDSVVSGAGASSLHQALQPEYTKSGHSDRLRLQTMKELGHSWTAGVMRQSVQATIGEWFNTYLAEHSSAD